MAGPSSVHCSAGLYHYMVSHFYELADLTRPHMDKVETELDREGITVTNANNGLHLEVVYDSTTVQISKDLMDRIILNAI